MGRQCHLDRFIDIEPFRMVIHFFRNQRRACHEAEGLVEILEYEFFCYGISTGDFRPTVKPCHRGFAGISRELLRHDTGPCRSDRTTLEKGSRQYYLLKLSPAKLSHRG